MKKKIIGIGSIVVLLIIGCVFYFTREEKITLSLKDKKDIVVEYGNKVEYSFDNLIQTKNIDKEQLKEVKKETEQTPEVETVSQDQFKQLQESLEALQTELEQVKKAKEEEKDQYMRVLAEYDNYRKRTDREKAATYDSATADTIAQFLPVVDNMELALAQADCSAEDLRKGVQMIQKNLNDILSKMGVAVMGTVGEPFNPEYHQAVSHIEDESLGENVIATVYRKGYRIGDKIVRHATVIVAN